MSRPLRIEFPDAWYHVMNRARLGQEAFPARENYLGFIELLMDASEMFNMRVAAYCLMANHYHLLIQTHDANLSRCMRHINGVYTQRYNARNGCDGTLFRGRYKAILVDGDSYLLELVRYIHRNPLRAGITDKLKDYSWSSHKGYCSRAKMWNWLHKDYLLTMFSPKSNQAKKAYLEFMQEQEPEEIESFYSKKTLASILGDDTFKDWIKEKFHNLRFQHDVPESKELALSGKVIRELVCRAFRVEDDVLMHSRRGAENIPRDVAIYLQRKYCGQTLAELGRDYNLAGYSGVSSAFERMKARLLTDRKLKKKVDRIEKKLD